jgi:hypothetical protein
VLVRGHDPDCPAIGSQAENARSAHEGNIMKVNDVGIGIVERCAQFTRFEQGKAGGL